MAKKFTDEVLRMLVATRSGLRTAVSGMIPKTKKDLEDAAQLFKNIKVLITGRSKSDQSPRVPLPARPADKPTVVDSAAWKPGFVGVPLRHHSQVEPDAWPSASGLHIALMVGDGGAAAATATAAAAEVGPVSPALMGATEIFLADPLPRNSRALLAASSRDGMLR